MRRSNTLSPRRLWSTSALAALLLPVTALLGDAPSKGPAAIPSEERISAPQGLQVAAGGATAASASARAQSAAADVAPEPPAKTAPMKAQAGQPAGTTSAGTEGTRSAGVAEVEATGRPSAETAEAEAAGAASAESAAAVAAQTLAAESPRKVRFRGMVQNDKLEPAAGATVTVAAVTRPDEAEAGPPQRMGGPGTGMRIVMAGRRDRGVKPSLHSAESDAAGAFSIEAGGEAEQYNLRVAAPGFAPTILENVKPGENLGTIFLTRGHSARGLVADLQNALPVQDAEVIAFPDEDRGFRDPDDPKRFAAVARTGRDGSFTVPNLEAGFHTFRVVAPGRGAFRADGKPVGDAEARPLVFYLEPGFDVSGRVVDSAGKPLAKVAVNLSPGRQGQRLPRMIRRGFTPVTAWTDKDGKYLLRGVPAEGQHAIEVSHDEYAPARLDIPASRASATVTGLDIRLERGSSLKAKLIDANQKPVTSRIEATLAYRDPKTRRSLQNVLKSEKETRITPSGEMSIDRLPTGTSTLRLSIEGYKDVERKDLAIGRDAKGVDLGTITLEAGKAITGSVVDAAGKPVASATVRGSSFEPPQSFHSAETRTDKSGKFTLGGLNDAEYTIEASANGFARARETEVKAGGDPVQLQLARAGSIKGRVVHGDPARPVTNFKVEADQDEPAEGGRGGFRMMMGRSTPRAKTNPRGEFSIDNLAPGQYSVTLSAEGLQDLVRGGVEVREAEATDLGDLLLEAGGTIRGRVLSKPEGSPVAGAAVRLKTSGLFDFRGLMRQGEETVLTDLGGRFELRGLPGGTVTLLVEPEAHAKAELAGVTVEAGRETEEIVIHVGKGGRIEGRVIGPDGRPQANAAVTAMAGIADLSAQMSAMTDETGRYAIENVAPGAYRVAQFSFGGGDDDEEGSGGGPRRFGGMDSTSAEVKDGETTIVNFGEKKIKVSGSLKRKEGETAKQMIVFVPPGRGMRIGAQMATTDDSGRYEVNLSEPGEYDIYVGDQRMRGGTAVKVTVPDKPDFHYDIVLPEGGISGRVIAAADGRPLSGVSVVATPEPAEGEPRTALRGGRGAQTTTGEDGTYTLKGLSEGIYDLSFSREGFGTEKASGVEVKGTDEVAGFDQILAEGVPVKVRVTGPSGGGVPGALVMVSQDRELIPTVGAMTRDDGALELKQLKPGTYSFLALTRDHAPGILRDVIVGGEDAGEEAVIVLTSGGDAKILVRDREKKPVSGVLVSLASGSEPDLDAALEILLMMRGGAAGTSADGTVLIQHLPTGKYEVTLSKEDKKITKLLAIEAEGSTAELSVTLD